MGRAAAADRRPPGHPRRPRPGPRRAALDGQRPRLRRAGASTPARGCSCWRTSAPTPSRSPVPLAPALAPAAAVPDGRPLRARRRRDRARALPAPLVCAESGTCWQRPAQRAPDESPQGDRGAVPPAGVQPHGRGRVHRALPPDRLDADRGARGARGSSASTRPTIRARASTGRPPVLMSLVPAGGVRRRPRRGPRARARRGLRPLGRDPGRRLVGRRGRPRAHREPRPGPRARRTACCARPA